MYTTNLRMMYQKLKIWHVRYYLDCSNLEISNTLMLETAVIQYKQMKSELERKYHANCEAINHTCSEHISSLTTQMASISDEIEQYDSVLDSINRDNKSRLDTKIFVKNANASR